PDRQVGTWTPGGTGSPSAELRVRHPHHRPTAGRYASVRAAANADSLGRTTKRTGTGRTPKCQPEGDHRIQRVSGTGDRRANWQARSNSGHGDRTALSSGNGQEAR